MSGSAKKARDFKLTNAFLSRLLVTARGEEGLLEEMLGKQATSSCTVSTSSCSINFVMLQAEELMQNYLRSKKLSWLEEELDRVLPMQTCKDTRARNALKKCKFLNTNL